MRIISHNCHPRVDGHRKPLTGTITLAIAAMLAVSLALAGVGFYGAVTESDAVSVNRQARSAVHSMNASVDELALQQETVAIWDDAAAHLVSAKRNTRWIHENIGSWLYKIFGHDEVFILNGKDQAIYASTRGDAVSTERYAKLKPELETLVTNLRLSHLQHIGVHDRRDGERLHPNSTVRTTSRPSHESHIMLIGGRPAAASAMLIQPSTPNYVRPYGKWPILISIRYIDHDFLNQLGERQLIASPRFSRRPEGLTVEHSVPLRAEGGKVIGYLIWRPELPGTRIVWNLGPLNLFILLALAIFMAFLGRRLSKAANELAIAEAHSAHLAYHDSLTGLPNRAQFQRTLNEAIGERPQSELALVLLDVDEFKVINDTLGHDAGDAVLTVFAERLRHSVRQGDTVARLGGDEFALILPGMHREKLEAFSSALLERLREPLEHRGRKIHARASIGASSAGDSSDFQDILKHADLALYEAKSSGGSFRMYDPTMWSSMLIRQEMLIAAQAVLEGHFVRPYYQPKINLKTGAIVGFEALLRCCLPDQPAKGPEYLLAALEDSDLAVQLSDSMINGVITDISAWQTAGLSFGHVAVNVTSADLCQRDFAERLGAKLSRARIPPECLQVEITESVLLGRGIDRVERTLRDLVAQGIKLALDDFGTGFASLTHLKRFPIEIIKIDRSFVRDLQIDAEDGAIVDALIGLGKALRIEVVAEGIETAAQRDFLSALGCAVGQGFLFGRALPAEIIAEMLRRPSESIFLAAA